MSIRSSKKQELMVYVVLWAAMFAVPVVSIEFHHSSSDSFPWQELYDIWFEDLNILIIFLLHNFLLAPLLVYKQRRLHYFTSIAVLVGCFVALQCVNRPEPRHMRPHHEEFMEDFRPPHHHEHHPDDVPPLMFGQHDLIASLILVLMLGMNIGVKLYFKQRDDQLRLQELERENLQQQLEYLRYQINPHFLMNTLNNIHALVDIDSERAKETIVELSKIMRFALYEGSQQRVPLDRDLAFMQSYIHLMRLRYTDKVTITVDIPTDLPNAEIPPMIFITFVENAFKHGVSYRQDSFIDIRFSISGNRLVFTCCNSKPAATGKAKTEGGVGLSNVKRRLELLYDKNFRLDIDEKQDTYNIKLEIPL